MKALRWLAKLACVMVFAAVCPAGYFAIVNDADDE